MENSLATWMHLPSDINVELYNFFSRLLLDSKKMHIAMLLLEGKKQKEVANALHTTLANVKKHIRVMKEQSGCSCLHDLTMFLGFVFAAKGVLLAKSKMQNGEKKIKFRAKSIL